MKTFSVIFLFLGAVALAAVVWIKSSSEGKPATEYESVPVAVLEAEHEGSHETASEGKEAVVGSSEVLDKALSGPEEVVPVDLAVSDRLADILDESLSYTQRLEAIRSLDYEQLSPKDIDTLLAYLKNPTLASNTVGASVKNDLLRTMLYVPSLSLDIGQAMIDVVSDDALPELWREYALQHYIFYYQNNYEGSPSTPGREDIFGAVKGSLLASSKEVETSLAGTALMNMSMIASEFPEVLTEDEVEVATLHVLDNEYSTLPSKIAAMQVLGKTQSTQRFEQARRVIESKDTHSMLKLAAVAVVAGLEGTSSHEDVVALLKRSSQSANGNKVVQDATTVTLKQFSTENI